MAAEIRVCFKNTLKNTWLTVAADKCEGFGLCKVTIGVARMKAPDPKAVPAKAEVRGDKMAVTFDGAVPPGGDVLPVSEDMILDAAVARGLGFKTVTILKGDYRIERAGSRFGSVVLNVKTTK
ncbi:MAG TPA: hypothetical protein VJH03_13460 [Blastocatellia bacterium]|nr:hypothetical protein [Blastocatellia bacterium]